MDEYEYKSFNLSTSGGMSIENLANQLGGTLSTGNHDFALQRGLEAGSYTVTRSNVLEIIDLETSERFVQNWSTSSQFVVPGDSPHLGSEGMQAFMPGTPPANLSIADRSATTNGPPPKKMVAMPPPPGLEFEPRILLPNEGTKDQLPNPGAGSENRRGTSESPACTPFLAVHTKESAQSIPEALPFQIPDDTPLTTSINGSKSGSVRVHVTRQTNAVRLPGGPPPLPAPPPLQQRRTGPPEPPISPQSTSPSDNDTAAASLKLPLKTVPTPPAKSSRLLGALAKPPAEMRLMNPPPPLKSKFVPNYAELITEDETDSAY